jgi:hypothetical protein
MTIESIESDKSSFRALLETWVYSELLKMCTQQNEPWNIYYYRDIYQVEVDFFLKIMHTRLLVLKLKQVKLLFKKTGLFS